MGPAAGYAAVAAHEKEADEAEHGLGLGPGLGHDGTVSHDNSSNDSPNNNPTTTRDTPTNLNLNASSPAASSPSTTLTLASPLTTPLLPFADQSSTPLSLVEDSPHVHSGADTSDGFGAGASADASAGTGVGVGVGSDADKSAKPATMPPTDSAVAASTAAASQSAQSAKSTQSTEKTYIKLQRRSRKNSSIDADANADPGRLISPTVTVTAQRQRQRQRNGHAKDHQQQHELLTSAPKDPVQAQPLAHDAPCSSGDADRTSKSSLSSPVIEPPLRTGSVQPDTRLAQPKPIQAILRTSSDTAALALKHPVSDLNTRSGAYIGNIAQLEATAERLSMTSSIDDAIRDLHGELKRSDSRRSSVLAAGVKASSIPDDTALPPALQRHLSNASSIVATNIAARHGGYSPAAYVMSPSHSFTGRLRSGSKGSSGRPDDVESNLSRHGPGKASVRSVRSTKMSLAEISESEPISLNQTAFDEADMAPPIEDDNDDTLRILEDRVELPSTDAFHQMLDDGLAESGLDLGFAQSSQPQKQHDRPATSRSNETFHVDPFVDFDGVHWEPSEEDLVVPPELEPEVPAPRYLPRRDARPQSYIDPSSGQHMLYYPAPVPAMINLPPKLGNKPKAAHRTQRRSQVLTAMADVNRQAALADLTGEASPDTLPEPMPVDRSRDSWLPDPLAGHRESFAALTTYDQVVGNDVASGELDPMSQPDPHPEPVSEQLRRPQKLSRSDPDNRKSRLSRLDNLPSQLRASAFFDLPSAAPKVEVKDGSAMATLESMLDASAHAPVSAFTDHPFSGKQGTEVYGREKKRKSQAAAAALRPVSSQEPKKRSSFMWLKPSGSHGSEKENGHRLTKSASMLGPLNDEVGHGERDALTESIDGESVLRHDREEASEPDYDSSNDDAYQGPPTTLLAELQLRKQQQKQRTQPLSQAFPNGMHATLLEMDAVAETQRKERQVKRVNLAWEDPDAHLDQNGSDDDDVPLAIIAAKQQGAKNMLDLEQPVGLLELREIEENEPLSRRRARLQGLDPTPMTHHRRQSLMNLTAASRMGARSPVSRPASREGHTPEPDEIEGETLGERKRRLAAQSEDLPVARPISSSFSAELLSQFGDLDNVKERPTSKSGTPPTGEPAEEETLGQRRRRLQAEREAREREMSYGNLVGRTPKLDRRMSLADVLPAHPKREGDMRAQEERRRVEEQERAARDQHAKLTAMRRQMPAVLATPGLDRSGGFRGGVYNDGAAGGATRSTPTVQMQGLSRATSYANVRQPYSGGAVQQPFAPYGQYGVPPQQFGAAVYGRGMAMQMPVATGSMDMVERWRQSVQP